MVREIAGDWLQLMTDTLKIEKFVVHGGDWGAAIASWLAVDAPEVLYGLHLTSAIIQPEISTVIDISDEEQVFLAQRENRSPSEGAYRVLQGSKPLTLSYSLSDSPVGLAAWLLEKYQAWGVSSGTQDPPSNPSPMPAVHPDRESGLHGLSCCAEPHHSNAAARRLATPATHHAENYRQRLVH